MVGNNIVNQSKQNTTTFYMLNQCIIGGGGQTFRTRKLFCQFLHHPLLCPAMRKTADLLFIADYFKQSARYFKFI